MTNEARYAANNTEIRLMEDQKIISERVHGVYEVIKTLWGKEYVKIALEKANALELSEGSSVHGKVLALQRIILKEDCEITDSHNTLDRVENELAKLVARQQLERRLQEDVDKLLEEKQGKLLDELKLSILKKKHGPENSWTFRKLVELQRLDTIRLSGTVMEQMRPSELSELVGQEHAVEAILSRLSTPYPQHMILYGPPGVGKTTAARLSLQAATQRKTSCFKQGAAFIEVDGTTLRWDRNEATNPLLGSVHDPIYQGSRNDFSELGIAEPKPGLVTDAHGGILFIDEIGELDPNLQNKLLKVLEDKRVEFSSSYFDEQDENVPAYIRKLFQEGAPADFILIGATTRQPQEINPALRSRCAEVFFHPLGREDVAQIVRNAGIKLGVPMEDSVPETIASYTLEGRRAVNILSDAYGNAIYRSETTATHIACADVQRAAALARLVPQSAQKSSADWVIGRVNGLGVSGFVGSVLEIEAVAFATSDGGGIRFNETAGSMTRDSVFNAAAVIRRLSGIDLSKQDIHVNVIGGGNVDGPSAGCAITVAILSALKQSPIRQNIALTGEISLLGSVRPVGGISEKIRGAILAGFEKVIIPYENRNEIPAGIQKIEIVPVKHIEEILFHVFAQEQTS